MGTLTAELCYLILKFYSKFGLNVKGTTLDKSAFAWSKSSANKNENAVPWRCLLPAAFDQ
jgi:hypothetical protein